MDVTALQFVIGAEANEPDVSPSMVEAVDYYLSFGNYIVSHLQYCFLANLAYFLFNFTV